MLFLTQGFSTMSYYEDTYLRTRPRGVVNGPRDTEHRQGIRWSSKVAENEGMALPESEKKSQKKISSGKYFSELRFLQTLKFLRIFNGFQCKSTIDLH